MKLLQMVHHCDAALVQAHKYPLQLQNQEKRNILPHFLHVNRRGDCTFLVCLNKTQRLGAPWQPRVLFNHVLILHLNR